MKLLQGIGLLGLSLFAVPSTGAFGIQSGARPDLVIETVHLSPPAQASGEIEGDDQYVVTIGNIGALPFIEDITISWRASDGTAPDGSHLDPGRGRHQILLPGGRFSVVIPRSLVSDNGPGTRVSFTIERPAVGPYRARYKEARYDNNHFDYLIPTHTRPGHE